MRGLFTPPQTSPLRLGYIWIHYCTAPRFVELVVTLGGQRVRTRYESSGDITCNHRSSNPASTSGETMHSPGYTKDPWCIYFTLILESTCVHPSAPGNGLQVLEPCLRLYGWSRWQPFCAHPLRLRSSLTRAPLPLHTLQGSRTHWNSK